MIRISRLIALAAAAALSVSAAQAQVVAGAETVVNNGDSSNRYDIVFVSEGYTAEEMGAYKSHVETAVGQLRSISPYAEYFRYLNIHRIDVPSAESGITQRGVNEVDTAFNVIYAPSDLGYLKISQTPVKRIVARHAPDADAIVVLLNGAGGGRSFGKLCVASTARFPFDNVVVHELGHSIAKCADEYEQMEFSLPSVVSQVGETIARPFLPLYGGFEFLNVTSRTSRGSIPWSHWIGAETPLPTPLEDGRTGLYEGALYVSENFYRPVPNCLMRIGEEMCPMCTERAIIKLSEKVVPYAFRWERTSEGVLQCGFTTIVPGPVRAKWFLDSGEAIRGVAVVRVNPQNFSGRRKELTVEVQDATAMVRKDEDQVLLHSHTFNLEKSGDEVRVRSQGRRTRRTGILGWFQSVFNPLNGDWSSYRYPSTEPDAIVPPAPGVRGVGAAEALRRIGRER